MHLHVLSQGQGNSKSGKRSTTIDASNAGADASMEVSKLHNIKLLAIIAIAHIIS